MEQPPDNSAISRYKDFDTLVNEGKHSVLLVISTVTRIVESKSYKDSPKYASISKYFKKYYGISRAQVYRLVDAKFVLLSLQSLAVELRPFKERQCRALKKAGNSLLFIGLKLSNASQYLSLVAGNA